MTLINTISSELLKIEDYQQQSEGRNDLSTFFAESYNELEEVLRHLQIGLPISDEAINEVRMIIKETERKATEL
jgi:hypothetical protein